LNTITHFIKATEELKPNLRTKLVIGFFTARRVISKLGVDVVALSPL
jgi:hypothetical protein